MKQFKDLESNRLEAILEKHLAALVREMDESGFDEHYYSVSIEASSFLLGVNAEADHFGMADNPDFDIDEL